MSERTDVVGSRLARLAPEVDMDASRALFERSRASSSPGRRVLLPAAVVALLVAGVLGLWAFARDHTAEAPATPVATTSAGDPTDAPPIDPVPGFEIVAIEETALEFGTILAATDENRAATLWTEVSGSDGMFAPFVDFDRRYVVAFTLPDDACPDRLVGFAEVPGDRLTLQPEFEPPPGGCNEPLITRTYVVALDRPGLPMDITFRLPRDDTYDYGPTELTVTVAPAVAGEGPETLDEPDRVATGVRVPLPPVGDPRLEAGAFGVVWVVQHDDGTVSVLDAVVETALDEDSGGVEGLGRLVAPVEGGGFRDVYSWDAHGRTIGGPRLNDLVGYAGVVDGDEVEIFTTNERTIPGEPTWDGSGQTLQPDLSTVELLDLDVLPTLSFRGPTWRHLDATLVVEGGVGRLCRMDASSPVPELGTCGGAGVETAIAAADRDITSWFFGPVLAEFDERGEIVTVVPLGGQASRNDGPDAVGAEPPSGDGWRQLPNEGDPVGVTPKLIVDPRQAGAPDADYQHEVVLVFDVFGNDCEPRLATVRIEDSVVEPSIVRPGSGCGESLVSYRFTNAIDRDRLGDVMVTDVPVEMRGPSTRTELPVIDPLADPVRPAKSDVDVLDVSSDCRAAPTLVVVMLRARRTIEVEVVVVTDGIERGRERNTLIGGNDDEVRVTVEPATDGDHVVVVREAGTDEIVAAEPYVECT